MSVWLFDVLADASLGFGCVTVAVLCTTVKGYG